MDKPQHRRKVLIVVSSYKPAISASMHRARLLAWHLRQTGWEFHILCPALSFQQRAWIDPEGDRFFAPDVKVTEATPLPLMAILKPLGIRGLSWQALLPIYMAGRKLLRWDRFDLVFFSTTAFNFFCLGRFWRRQFGVPYVLDFQDPWLLDRLGSVATTKHLWKARIANRLASILEGFSVRKAEGLLAVSPNYLLTLKQRYPAATPFKKDHALTIPFGAHVADFVDSTGLARALDGDRALTIAYVGAGGKLMARSFEGFASSLARLSKANPQIAKRFRIRLVGTGDWAGSAKVLKNRADELGLAELVTESPAIVPYSEATRIASDADGLLVFGVDEPAYMASKLFSYACLGKPLLASISRLSQMHTYFERFSELGVVIRFDGEDERQIDAKVFEFLNQMLVGYRPQRERVFREHSAVAMTDQIAKFFDTCLAPSQA